MEINDKIKRLEDKIAELKAALLSAERSLFKARCDKAGVHIGDIVVSKGIEYRVCEIKHVLSQPWVSGAFKKKNGEWSDAVRNLYNDWELKK